MLKRLLKSACLLLPFMLSGCLTVQPVDTRAIARIKTVHLIQPIPLPQDIFYHSLSEGLATSAGGGIAGVFISALAMPAAVSGHVATQKCIQDHHIDMAAILRQEFVKTVAARGPFVIVPDNVPADGDLSLSVERYGLSVSNAFSSSMYGYLVATAVVILPDGKVLWRSTNTASAHDSSDMAGYSPDEFLAAPERITDAFVRAADIVSARVLDDAANP